MHWGGLSDRVGRKPVLLLGCIGTMLSLVMVGFASNLWVALAGRALGGLLNGNIGVVQTMVGELVTKPEHERKYKVSRSTQGFVFIVVAFQNMIADMSLIARAYSVLPFVWSIGTIIGPAIGGTFADPHEAYPGLFPKGGLFDRLPYLLPNLICAGLLLLSVVLGYFLLEETHPDMQPRVLLPDDTYISAETPLMETSDAMKRPAVDVRSGTYGTFNANDSESTLAVEELPRGKDATPQTIFTKPIVSLLVALSLFTYHSMTYDHLLPIFFEDGRVPLTLNSMHVLNVSTSALYSPGGLGLSVQSVGGIMAVNGVIALFVQAVIFPVAAAKVGIHRLFILVTVLHPVAYLIVPFLLYVPEPLLYPAIYACLTVRNIFSIILYPLLLILIKEATPSHNALGRVNGLAASCGAACRMVAPPVAGYLYAAGSRADCTAVAWVGSAVVAGAGAFQCFSVKRVSRGSDEEGKRVSDDDCSSVVSIITADHE